MIAVALLISFLSFLLLLLVLLYFVPKLLLAERRRKKGIDRIAKERGWHLDRTQRDALPPELAGETIFNMGDPETYHSFSVFLTIEGTYRDRAFLLLSRGCRRYRRQDGHSTTYLFAKLSDTAKFTPFFIHPKSGVMDGFLQMDAAAKTADKTIKSVFFSKLSMPAPFSESYTLRGLSGAQDHLTDEVQQALIDRPDLFRRMEEKWHKRLPTYPGVSERLAWVDIQGVDPETLFSRLDTLMDWADIIEPSANTGDARV